jgi:hypothetical protein
VWTWCWPTKSRQTTTRGGTSGLPLLETNFLVEERNRGVPTMVTPMWSGEEDGHVLDGLFRQSAPGGTLER